MQKCQKNLVKLALILVASFVGQVYAAVVYNEAIDGDLSGNMATPSLLSLSIGTNTVLGQIGDNGFTGATNGLDADYFTFSLPSTLSVTSITIDAYDSSGVNTQTQSFLGYRVGSSFSGQGFGDIDEFVLFNAGSGEILDDLTGSLAPLGLGDYAFWFQETAGGSLIDYSISFEVVNAVPVPAALPLFLSAIGMTVFSRRKE